MNGKMKVFLPVLGWEGGWMNDVVRMERNGTGFRRPGSVSQTHLCVICTSIYVLLAHL